jgi:hypothetical protein
MHVQDEKSQQVETKQREHAGEAYKNEATLPADSMSLFGHSGALNDGLAQRPGMHLFALCPICTTL